MSIIKALPQPSCSKGYPVAAHRRQFCQSLLAGASLMGVGCLPVGVAAAKGQPLDLSHDPDLLQAMMKMRGTLGSELVIGWVRAKRFAVSDGRIEPLCGLIACTFNLFTQKSDDLFEVATMEIAHYTDFDTGQVIDGLTMPFTNQQVDVPEYRYGPMKVRYAVRVDESEDVKPRSGTNEDAFSSVGTMRMNRGISFEGARHGMVFLRHEEHARVQPADGGTPPMFYKESTIWTAPAAEVLDSTVPRVDAGLSYSAMTSWRPWMKVGDLPGHTMSNGFGGKAATIQDLPADFLKYTKQRHPDVLQDPLAILATLDE